MTTRATLAGIAVAGLLVSAACDPQVETVEEAPPAIEIANPTGDWPVIKQRGQLRLVRRSWVDFDTLESQGLSAEQYRHMAEGFAARNGLDPVWLIAADMDELFDAVTSGRADIAASNITVTPKRAERVAFSLPLTRSREWVIGVDESGTFGVAEHTAYVDTLAQHYPDAVRTPVPADADPMAFLTMIEDGVIDATIMDEAAARVVVRASDTVRKLRELPEAKDHAWALRRDNPALKQALDAYLLERHTVATVADEVRDWPAIKASGQLRLLTLNAPTTYYLWRGAKLGFEYELIESFAALHDLELHVAVARRTTDLFDWLAEGRGDVIAAGLTPTPERIARGMRFTRPYLEVRSTFVTAGTPIVEHADLAGRRIAVNPVTSHAARLAELREQVAFETELVADRTHAILESVAAGDLDATLVDGHFAALEASFDPKLSLGLALEPPEGLCWAVHESSTEFHRLLDDFVAERYRGYEFNVLRHKYFGNERRMGRQREERIDGHALSPYDDIVRPLAQAAGFDWRLIVAQMYQESGFDPDRVSFAGAKGLMQVMPRTAHEIGVDPEHLADPATGIETGIKYLSWTHDRFPDLPVGERLWFALAAYNAGPGHVRDGRRLARRLGLDGSLWFDNVESAMLKLAEPEYASRAAYGYVRGSEVTGYVRDIRDRYGAYVNHFRLLDGSG